MSDLIKREDAIKAIEDRRCWLTLASQHGDMGRVLWDEYYIKFEDAIEALLLIQSADRPQEWIPCSERLPKENTEVLMSLEWGIDIGECRNGDWHSEWINHYDDGNVLAWMPLPEAWKGADDE